MKKTPFVVLFTLLFLLQCIFSPIGNQLNVFAEEIPLDTEAPTAPSDLVFSSETATTVTFTWTGSTDNIGVLEYDVYRDSSKIGTTNDLTFTDENLTSETTYTYFIKAKDAAGNESEPSSSLVVSTESGSIDTQAPSAPSNLSLSDKTDTTISLQWDASTDDVGVSGYDICYIDITMVENVTGSAITVSGLNPDSVYNLTVKARDMAGNISAPSNAVSVRTLLSATDVTVNPKTTKIIVSWDSLAGAAGYEIEADGTVTGTGTDCTYTHEGLLSNTSHIYRVRGINVDGEAGIWSQGIEAATGILPVPANIQTSQTFTSITVSWDSVDEADEYELEADGILISNMLETSYTHPDLMVNSPHTYRVRSKNTGGHSEWSELKTVTTTSYGTGTLDDPFIITTLEKLLDVKNNLAASYKLGCDIDLEGVAWEPVGSSGAPFTGTFDGNGYTLSNFTINKTTTDYVGFFGKANNATIKNLILNNISVTGQQYTGGLVGQAIGASTIQNCSVKGTSTVTGIYYVGGLVGNAAGTVDKCSSEANVTLTGTGLSCGGLIGVNSANVSKSYSTGNVTSGGGNTGGLIGVFSGSSLTITECYSTGNVSSGGSAGGLIGCLNSSAGTLTVSNNFSLGNVTAPANSCTGGLIGQMLYSNGMVKYCYSTGSINSSGSYLGGLFGADAGTVTGCYYDGIASGYIPEKASDAGKLTSGMKSKATFNGWDFSDVWAIDEGSSYPYLRNVLKPSRVSMGLPANDVTSGNGTASNPYIITLKEHLINLKYDLSGNYKLGANVDLQNAAWEPAGNSVAPFAGTFDGNGYTVSNFTISKSTTDYIGFFGKANNATIKNLILNNISVTGQQYTGGLVGQAIGTSTIQNCSVKGTSTVTGIYYVGGLVGNTAGMVDKCSSEANVTLMGTGMFCGGLIGLCTANVSKSYSTGNVTGGGNNIGGLIGQFGGNGFIVTECYTTGNVSGGGTAGGLIGCLNSSGGIVTVSNDFSLGNVTTPANSCTGGLIGQLAYSNGVVKYCYSTGSINSSGSYLGGLFGADAGTVTGCYYDGIASGYIPEKASDTSKLTSGMKSQTTFNGWDFTGIWAIDEGSSYPYLRSIQKPIKVNEGLPINDVASGNGTASNPYIITSKEHLINLKYDLSGNYKLGGNIDFQNTAWEPVGSSAAPFTGTFDGNGYVVSNFTINKATINYVGFFGYMNNATIKNLILNHISVTGQQYAGGLAGYTAGTSIIQDCSVKGTSVVSGTGYTGGLIGQAIGTVSRCSSEANITLTGTGSYCGGLIGVSSANTSKSYATGNVTSSGSYTGGLLGALSGTNINITECYSTGNISGGYSGGFIGTIGGTGGVVSNCYSLGNVTAPANTYVGGLVGYFSSGTVRYCYSVGLINSSGSYVNGLIGYSAGTITSSYFDSTVTGITTPTTQARTTAQLKQQATYTSWDFTSIWSITESVSYPSLKNTVLTGYIPVPTGLAASNVTENSIDISWQDITDALRYDLEIDGVVNDVGLNTNYTHTGLLPGTNHTYRVRQINTTGQGEWSMLLTKCTLLPVPANITAIPSISDIIITWDAVTGAQYDIEVDGIIINCGTETGYTHTDLLPETQHTYRVRSKNSITASPWSEQVSSTTLPEVYPYPRNLHATPMETIITIEWDPAEGATGYELSVDGIVQSVNQTIFIHSGLVSNTQHEYKVRALYSDGVSIWSPELVIATLSDMPGSGTAADPYIIKTVDTLKKVKNNLTAYYKLANNLDLQNAEWTPIGTNTTPFTGTFDGDRFSINNLKISKSTTDYIGLFGYTNNAIIKNLSTNNINITGRSYVGTLIGYSGGTTSSIQNCMVAGSGTVTGAGYIGGLIGSADGIIDNCSSTVNVSSTGYYAGGLVGRCGITTKNSYATGNVTSGNIYAGGLVGVININNASISQCYASGNVSGTQAIGGLVGYYGASTVTLRDCYALGNITATNNANAGGLVGNLMNSYLSIINCYYAGVINSTGSTTGGLVGVTFAPTITSSYYDGLASRFIPQNTNDISKLTTGLKYKSTFTGWDFTGTWNIDEGTSYPYLRSVAKPSKVNEGLPVNDVAGGKGTAAEPYLISTKEQMNNVKYDLTGSYKLINNIDLENSEWMPTGNNTAPFTGTFDGDGHSISNLLISKSTINYIGLFGYTNNATIKNLNINNVNVAGKSYVGTLVGYAGGSICNIQNCTVEESGTVTGISYIGGLIGSADGIIDNCSSTENVVVSGTGGYAGGLVGRCGITTKNSYATGNITSGGMYAGGLVGVVNINNASISQCYASGNVSGTQAIGGLVGYYGASTVTLRDCYALGNITATNNVNTGGLVGNLMNSYLSIINCYFAGTINSTGSTTGGLVGVTFAPTITSSYYDGLASRFVPQNTNDISKLTTGLKYKSTFIGWDFTGTWNIDEGTSYPYLRSLAKPSSASEGLPVNDVAGGKGTAAEPYLISTKEQMNNVKYDLTGSYKLINNIDLENIEWTSAGTNILPYTGTFDGDGLSIINLKINKSTTDYIGLFGYTNNVTIKNLNINNISITGRYYVGGLAGYAAGSVNNIQNCSVTGTGNVSGGQYTGGLIGYSAGTVSLCSTTIIVSSTTTNGYVGGLIGGSDATVSKCYTTGSISSSGDLIGGLIGGAPCNTGTGNISECYTTGNVSGRSMVGGLIGRYYGTASTPAVTISNCYALGNITATQTSSPFVGGLIGYIFGYNSSFTAKVINSYSSGVVTGGTSYIGGLIGYYTNTTITSSYFDSIKTGFTTPTTQARTTTQLKQQATFTGWDFTNTWKIDEGTSYPYLRLLQAPISLSATSVTENIIGLSWKQVAGATGYEIEVDGTVNDCGLNTTYQHTGLQPGTEHSYRVRSIASSVVSPWSNILTVVTLFPGQIGLTLNVSESDITALWNEVEGAVSYDIEVDGMIINNGLSTTYIHNLTIPNIQHTYRVRARTEKATTPWSPLYQAINWSQNSPGVCLAETNWVSDPGQYVEVVIKANNIPDMYTSYFVLQFDPQALEPDTQSITNLIWFDATDVYTKYAVYWETGKVKILVSRAGEVTGSNGQFDIVKLNFRLKSSNTSQINANLAKLVDASGEYIDIPNVQPLNIRILGN